MVNFSFGKRRIVGMNYTRYVSLPKDWLKFKGLEKGDEIEVVIDEDKNLILKATHEGENDE